MPYHAMPSFPEKMKCPPVEVYAPVNRSMPPATVIPVLEYLDVLQAAQWLCQSFGFVERLRIGDHRIQLSVGSGSVVLAQGSSSQPACEVVESYVPFSGGDEE